MTQAETLFGNPFDGKNIIPTRLANFASDTLNHLTAANGGGNYTSLINQLTPVLADFEAELGVVDTSLNIQKGATLTNDQVTEQFKATMSNEEPFIARALGGKNMPAYLQFYPQGITEYSQLTKTSMPILTDRVKVAATANATALGATLTATLQAFEASWTASRNTQQQQMGSVDENRSGRSQARSDVELVLITIVHTIGGLFPGNVEQCSAFFNFNLLLPQTKRKHKKYAGTLAASQTITVLNRTFTDTATLTLRNPDDNAPIAVWLAATSTQTSENPLIVQPGQAHEVKPSALGDLKNTFLLIKNMSEVNEGAYEAEVVG